jgi:hypothetical protein
MPHVFVTVSRIFLVVSLVLASGRAAESVEAQEKKTGRARIYRDYQVVAGTYLTVELRSDLSSNTSRVFDPVRGRLARAVTHDGMELLPAGSILMGTVTQVEPAGKKQRGYVAFTFHVIEHPDTGSRATIRAEVLEFYSERPAKGNVFPELRLEKWGEVALSLRAPLTVRIPVQNTGSTPEPR